MDKEKPTLKISDLIQQLEIVKSTDGDCEVFMANEEEACFDGVGTVAVIAEASTGMKSALLIRNKAVLKV